MELMRPGVRTFGLGFFEQIWWVDNKALETAFEFLGQVKRVLKIVVDEFFAKDGKAPIVFKKIEM